ncbi:MAG: class I SAM-dependent methyltransferase [Pseudomonadota bacterium]
MSAYAASAAFYDAIAGGAHAAVDAQIAEALGYIERPLAPVVDIGAGTGLSTRVIADALPGATILAIEPDPAMRAGLLTRVWSQPALRHRVSILPMELFDAPLPDIVSAFVASASLVHFSPVDRQRLWALIALHLAPSGCAVLEIQSPEARDVAESVIATAQVGAVTYAARASAEAIDSERLRWRVDYVASFEGAEVDSQCSEYLCWAVSANTVLTEAAKHGLRGQAKGDLVVLHR